MCVPAWLRDYFCFVHDYLFCGSTYLCTFVFVAVCCAQLKHLHQYLGSFLSRIGSAVLSILLPSVFAKILPYQPDPHGGRRVTRAADCTEGDERPADIARGSEYSTGRIANRATLAHC